MGASRAPPGPPAVVKSHDPVWQRHGPEGGAQGPVAPGRSPSNSDGLDARLSVAHQHVADEQRTVEELPLVVVERLEADRLLGE